MNTNQDLPEMLRQRNKDGKYDELIKKAEAFGYHDFKGYNALPKMTLVKDLELFPELADISTLVMKGQFDESLFEEEEEDTPPSRA
jgi:hypothetical protein